MTLKEKLEIEIMDLPIMSEVVEDIAKNLEYVVEDFAVGFFNWATSYKANDKNNWILTTKQLLEIYKNETTNK